MQIVKRKLIKELKYEDTVVLKYNIEYPEIIGVNNVSTIKFNRYNKNLAVNLQTRVENELYDEAVELYKYNKENRLPNNAIRGIPNIRKYTPYK